MKLRIRSLQLSLFVIFCSNKGRGTEENSWGGKKQKAPSVPFPVPTSGINESQSQAGFATILYLLAKNCFACDLILRGRCWHNRESSQVKERVLVPPDCNICCNACHQLSPVSFMYLSKLHNVFVQITNIFDQIAQCIRPNY